MLFLVNGIVEVYVNLHEPSSRRWGRANSTREGTTFRQLRQNPSQDSSSPVGSGSQRITGLRRTNAERSLLNKKRVIKMLFTVVLEFFICWTPLYVINTIALFNSSIIYHYIGYTNISYFHLLAYTSSCCNPITYCFMNYGFRKSFLNLFRCARKYRNRRKLTMNGCEFNMESKWTNKSSDLPA